MKRTKVSGTGRLVALVAAVALALAALACSPAAAPQGQSGGSASAGSPGAQQAAIENWEPDSPAMRSIVELVSYLKVVDW